jgi:hypothetical protein
MIFGVTIFANVPYAINASRAFFLNNVFVSIAAKPFMKLSALKALAPMQSEPPFMVAQLTGMAIFVVLGIFAAQKFRAEQLYPA